MPTPTIDQLRQFRVDYVDSWNEGDKERFAANWRQFLADDDGFQMFDPVGTPMKRGLVGCALEPFDLWQPAGVRVPPCFIIVDVFSKFLVGGLGLSLFVPVDIGPFD